MLLVLRGSSERGRCGVWGWFGALAPTFGGH